VGGREAVRGFSVANHLNLLLILMAAGKRRLGSCDSGSPIQHEKGKIYFWELAGKETRLRNSKVKVLAKTK